MGVRERPEVRMKTRMKRLIRQLVPTRIVNATRELLTGDLGKRRVSYSQEGEDLILDRFFEGKTAGFFVDVGAYHPWYMSNTYLFYKKGWRGINIDARPGTMDLFRKQRPQDINVEAPIAQTEEIRTFYMFNEPGLNTFLEEEAKKRDGWRGEYRIIDRKPLKTRRLDKLLDELMPAGVKLDFISIDVEGLDLEVLRSNNWEKYIPTIVIIEQLDCSVADVIKSEAYAFLNGLGYELYAKCFNSVFFKRR